MAWFTVSRLRPGPDAQWHAAARQPARSHAGNDGDAQSCTHDDEVRPKLVLLQLARECMAAAVDLCTHLLKLQVTLSTAAMRNSTPNSQYQLCPTINCALVVLRLPMYWCTLHATRVPPCLWSRIRRRETQHLGRVLKTLMCRQAARQQRAPAAG